MNSPPEPNGSGSVLNNPLRFSLGGRRIDVEQFDVEVTEIDVRPDEGNFYVYWRER